MKHGRVDRRLRLQIIFAFLIVYPVLLYIEADQPTRAQVLFHGAVLVVGLIGLVVVSRGRRH